jgi:hypothetical protein
VRTNLVEHPVQGSAWALDSACGPPMVEGAPPDTEHMIDCGMGFVPSRSARFLYWLSRDR